MGSLIKEIQIEALDPNSSITFLLKKAYVAAKKLNLIYFEEWLNLELNGYFNDRNKIPEYRKVQCTLMGYNQFREWEEVIWVNDDPCDTDSHNINKSIISICEPISSFELKDSNSTGSFLLSLSPESQKQLNKTSNYSTSYAYKLGVPTAKTIISRVNNVVLDWALELEQQGIIGEDMSFNDKDKKIAANNPVTNNYFHGNVNNSQIQQNSNNSSQSLTINQDDKQSIFELISLISSNISELPTDHSNIDEITDQLETIQNELTKAEPQKSIISKCFSTVKNIVSSIPTNLIVSGIISEIDKLNIF